MTLIGLMCLGAMGLGFYRGWSDTFTAASDSEAEVLRWSVALRACQCMPQAGRGRIGSI